MTEALPSDPPDIDSSRSGIQPTANGFSHGPTTAQLDHLQALNDPTASTLPSPATAPVHASKLAATATSSIPASASTGHLPFLDPPRSSHGHALSFDTTNAYSPPSLQTVSGQTAFTKSAQDEGKGSVLDTKERQSSLSQIENGSETAGTEPQGKKRTLMEEVRRSCWLVLTHSWTNVLLIFVPLGIILANVNGIHGGVVFAMNCIAVIPLAGLLSFATESVASKMGDALGALLNVTFGNAVELIIFIIALVKNEIRIVQASLLGSILANLLLILGMCFFFGGLRYREQVYNSTVTQMSACLLSLSVISLVLPTAFHASFKSSSTADAQSLKISRGTSVILLLVYIIYLLFQLKSHAYMYESTPQHIVDAEAIPGPAAGWLDSSSSDSDSSSSSDSDDSGYSRDTMKRRMKKVLRGGRKRKPSNASTASFGTVSTSPNEGVIPGASTVRPEIPRFGSTDTNEEMTEEEDRPGRHRRHSIRNLRRKYNKKKRHHRHRRDENTDTQSNQEPAEKSPETIQEGEPRRVDFAIQNAPTGGDGVAPNGSKRPFPALRGMSVKNLAPTVFVQKPQAEIVAPAPAGPVPRVRYGIRRTNSLPDRLNQYNFRAPGAMLPAQIPLASLTGGTRAVAPKEEHDEEHLSKWASVILLLVSTGLVAVCAEFLIDSIEAVTSTTSIGEAFIGLILLPIVGNAAEHVTALTVAMKNKVDLAIGVAIGSSIQIAIFVTPLVVILGWILNKEMTLYFTLFETVSLFVSTFIINFLILDGRSNYLEGALLCAVYCIIGTVAFFYPEGDDVNQWG